MSETQPQKKARPTKKAAAAAAAAAAEAEPAPVAPAPAAAAPAPTTKKRATKKAAAAPAAAAEPVAQQKKKKKKAATGAVAVPEAVAQAPAAGAGVEKKKKKKSRSTAAQNRRALSRIRAEARQTGPAIRETSFRKLLKEVIALEQGVLPLGPKGEPVRVRLSTKAGRNIHGMVEAQLVRALAVPAHSMYAGRHKTFKYQHLETGLRGLQMAQGLRLNVDVPERDDLPTPNKPATPVQGRDDQMVMG